MGVDDQVTEVLDGASTWLAFNVSRDSISRLAQVALNSGVKKALFTLELQPSQVNETSIPEFNEAELVHMPTVPSTRLRRFCRGWLYISNLGAKVCLWLVSWIPL